MKRFSTLILLCTFSFIHAQKLNVAINGFGRIGKAFLRSVLQDPSAMEKLNVAVINTGSHNFELAAHLFCYDSLMGTYPGKVRIEDDHLVIDDYKILCIAQRDPANIDWGAYDIDWVVESTGHFTKREDAQKHIDAGACNVLITAPAKDEDITFILGVNDDEFNPKKHHIVSPGSCTSNALAPLVKLMNDHFGIEHAFFSTVHAFTASQALLDANRSDARRSRAAPFNIVPTSTGAAKFIGKVIPEVGDIMSGYALRVPIGKVSILDVMFVAKEPICVEAIHDVIKTAAAKKMKGVVGFTTKPLVSSDYSGICASIVVDGLLTEVMGNTARLTGWYDNEWGYSCRLKDFLVHCAD